jgi:hypothetical protein
MAGSDRSRRTRGHENGRGPTDEGSSGNGHGHGNGAAHDPTTTHRELTQLLTTHQAFITAAQVVLAELPTTATMVQETLTDLCAQHERSIAALQIVIADLPATTPGLDLAAAPEAPGLVVTWSGRRPTTKAGRRARSLEVLTAIERAGGTALIAELGGRDSGVPALLRYRYLEHDGQGRVRRTDKPFIP